MTALTEDVIQEIYGSVSDLLKRVSLDDFEDHHLTPFSRWYESHPILSEYSFSEICAIINYCMIHQAIDLNNSAKGVVS